MVCFSFIVKAQVNSSDCYELPNQKYFCCRFFLLFVRILFGVPFFRRQRVEGSGIYLGASRGDDFY